MIGVSGATLATQTANPVTAVVKEVQMRTLVLDPVTARYIVYSSNVPLSKQKVMFLGFSEMSASIKQVLQLPQYISTTYSVCGSLVSVFRYPVHCSKTPAICLKTHRYTEDNSP